MPESLPMKTRLLLAGASLQLISLAKKSEKKEKKQKVVAVSAGMTLSDRQMRKYSTRFRTGNALESNVFNHMTLCKHGRRCQS